MVNLPTVGVISQRLGVPVHRVDYVISTRGIEPVGRAGTARVFSEQAVARIREELTKIEAERSAVS